VSFDVLFFFLLFLLFLQGFAMFGVGGRRPRWIRAYKEGDKSS